MSRLLSLEAWFSYLIGLQFLLVAGHDLIDVQGLTHGSQVKAAVGQGKIWLVTLVNAAFPGAAVALAVAFWARPKPRYVFDYWVVYCAVTVISALVMWWVPYFWGASPKTKAEHLKMYAGTWHVLPARGDNPRPNLLHVVFHCLFLATLTLAVTLRISLHAAPLS